MSVAFSAPTSTGGASIINYQYSVDNGATYVSAGTTTSPLVITGLTNGVAYQVVIRAANTESLMPSQAPLQFPRGFQDGSNTFCPSDVGAFYLYNAAVSQEDIIRNYDATKARYAVIHSD